MRLIRLTQPGKSSEHQILRESERFETKGNINKRLSFRGYLNRMNRTHHTATTQVHLIQIMPHSVKHPASSHRSARPRIALLRATAEKVGDRQSAAILVGENHDQRDQHQYQRGHL